MTLGAVGSTVTGLLSASLPSTFYLLRQHLLSRSPRYSAGALEYPLANQQLSFDPSLARQLYTSEQASAS